MSKIFPEFITDLPRPDTAFDIDAHIVPSEFAMTMFYSTDTEIDIPEHSHGPQWGVVLAGSMEMTIGGVSKTLGVGESYYVPDGVEHTTKIGAGYSGIDVFSDAHRYEVKQ